MREDNHLQRSAPPEHAMDTGGDLLAGRRTLESEVCIYLVIMNISIIYIHLTFMYIKSATGCNNSWCTRPMSFLLFFKEHTFCSYHFMGGALFFEVQMQGSFMS